MQARADAKNDRSGPSNFWKVNFLAAKPTQKIWDDTKRYHPKTGGRVWVGGYIDENNPRDLKIVKTKYARVTDGKLLASTWNHAEWHVDDTDEWFP